MFYIDFNNLVMITGCWNYDVSWNDEELGAVYSSESHTDFFLISLDFVICFFCKRCDGMGHCEYDDLPRH